MDTRYAKWMGGGAVDKRLRTLLAAVPGKEALKRWGIPKPLRRIFMFWILSVSGWCMDILLLLFFTWLGVPVFVAVCMALIPALTWMFFLSTYKIYFKGRGFSNRKFGLYVAYNTTMMLLFAGIISKAAHMGYGPVTMKVAVAPVTFLMNYAFTKYLLKRSR